MQYTHPPANGRQAPAESLHLLLPLVCRHLQSHSSPPGPTMSLLLLEAEQHFQAANAVAVPAISSIRKAPAESQRPPPGPTTSLFLLQAEQHFQAANAVAAQAISSIRTVAAFCMQPDICARYAQHLKAPSKRIQRSAISAGVAFGVANCVTYAVNALAFWYGGHQVASGSMSLTDMLKVRSGFDEEAAELWTSGRGGTRWQTVA